MPILYKDEEKGKMLCLQYDRCKGCELCIHMCPRNVLELSTKLNKRVQYPPAIKDRGECTLCRICEYICPDFSIYVTAISEV